MEKKNVQSCVYRSMYMIDINVCQAYSDVYSYVMIDVTDLYVCICHMTASYRYVYLYMSYGTM